MMEITKVHFTKTDSGKVFATLILDNILIIRHIEVVENKKGITLIWPTFQADNENELRIIDPVNQKLIDKMQARVEKQYNECKFLWK